MMHADRIIIHADIFPFPENSDRPRIPRDSQPDVDAHQAMKIDRMGRSIPCPGKDILSAFIRVTSALIGGKKPLLILFV